MTDEKRVVLIKPGEILIIGNADVAALRDANPDDMAAHVEMLRASLKILGIDNVLIFGDDITIGVSPADNALIAKADVAVLTCAKCGEGSDCRTCSRCHKLFDVKCFYNHGCPAR